MLGTELERCWIDTSLGVLLLLVSIEFDIVYPWLLESRSHVVQLGHFLDIAPSWVSVTTLDFQSLASLLSRRMCYRIFLLDEVIVSLCADSVWLCFSMCELCT